MHKVKTADTQALIALHEAQVALARAELALAQVRAGAVPIAAAPKPKPAPKPAKAAPKPAKPAFAGEIAQPDAPATPRQLWMLHLLLPGRPDTRGMPLTRAEASARIGAAKAAAAARKATPAA
jgi:hypothetical protein